MNILKKLTITAFAMMMTAAFCACGQPTDSTADSVETDTVSTEPSETDAPAANGDVEVGSEMTIGIAPIVASAGQKSVPVDVKVWNNKGFSACGIRLDYDPALKAVSNGNFSPISGAPEAQYARGEAGQGFMVSCLIGEEVGRIAFGAMNTEVSTVDGVIFTCYFDVPDDAASGTEYPITVTMDSLNDANSQPLSYETIDGIIRIE